MALAKVTKIDTTRQLIPVKLITMTDFLKSLIVDGKPIDRAKYNYFRTHKLGPRRVKQITRSHRKDTIWYPIDEAKRWAEAFGYGWVDMVYKKMVDISLHPAKEPFSYTVNETIEVEFETEHIVSENILVMDYTTDIPCPLGLFSNHYRADSAIKQMTAIYKRKDNTIDPFFEKYIIRGLDLSRSDEQGLAV